MSESSASSVENPRRRERQPTTLNSRPPRHRLDLIPYLALTEPLVVGEVQIGPYLVLGSTMYPSASVRRTADSMVRYHRLYDGGAIPNPTVIASADGSELPIKASDARMEHIDRSIEAFRYSALLADRTGHGPNSTHLHVEAYGFGENARPWLTVRSRFTQIMGVRGLRHRSWPHISPVQLATSQLDRELLDQLAACAALASRKAVHLWRGIWWFNQAHHDDPYMPIEFSILSLATAFEALIRPPGPKVEGLQAAVRKALGTSDFDGWVSDFYNSRSDISHGSNAWEPRFGARRHVDHYRIAKRLFPVLVEGRLVDLGVRQKTDQFMQSMRRHVLSRLLTADSELVDRLVPETLDSLRGPRNAARRLDLKFLPIRLNDDDFSTPAAKYAELLEWLRRIAISACRSAAVRWPEARTRYHELRRQFAAGMPPIRSAGVIAPETDEAAFFGALMRAPEHRPIIGDISLVDLAESMQAVEWRRQMASLRESTGLG
jgi:hypothetical protein